MSESQRTLFATLLARHRDNLNLTQAEVAARTYALHDAGAAPRAITERTISALEGLTPGQARVPHQATVRSLAMALELEPGTPDHDALLAAARQPTAVPTKAVDEPDAMFLPEGREPQLARLERAIDTASHGSPSIALLTGDAGSGKSRLLREIARRALDRDNSAVVLWGNCPRGFGAIADHEPWRQILAQMLRDPYADDGSLPVGNAARLDARLPLAATALAGPAARLVGRLTAADALRWPHVLEALDPDATRNLTLAPATAGGQHVTREDIDNALVTLLESYASAGPVVIVLENLHWADSASSSTIPNIVSELLTRHLPVALLGSVRTGDQSSEGNAATFVAGVTAQVPDAVVDLASTIGGAAGKAFVDAAVARLDLKPLAERLFERTGGMPLFVMSFLRLHAVDPGAIPGESVPVEIDAVLARQLSHLDERARTLLAAASVQGDEFLAEPALAVAGIPTGERVRYFDNLLASQVRYVGPQQVTPTDTMHRYAFRHALLHDHVTGTLSRLERSHLHLDTAGAIERALGPRNHDLVDLVASQYEQGGDLRRAASTWLAAGDRALARSDHRHARSIFRHIRQMGLEPLAPELHVQAQVGIGNSLRALGHPAEARHALQRARREAKRKQLDTVDANALMSLGVLDFDTGRMVAGAARFASAIDAYNRAGDVEDASRANANLSLALHGMGRYDEARARAEDGIALAERAGSVGAVASAEIALSNCWLDLGYYERAIARYESGHLRNDAHGLTHYGNICLLNIALCHIEMRRWDDAEAVLKLVDDPDRKLIDRMRSVLAFNGALIMEGRGDASAAWHRYELSRQIRQQLGQAPLLIDSLAGLLRIATATNDLATAMELVAELESRVSTQGTIGVEHLGRLHLTMIEGHRMCGNTERAMAWLFDAVAMLRDRADQLSDPDHRHSYLTRPPAHHRIIALARKHGIQVPEAKPTSS